MARKKKNTYDNDYYKALTMGNIKFMNSFDVEFEMVVPNT